MTDEPTITTRSAAMTRAWATRKANAALLQQWFERPVCLCGCGKALANTSFRFAQGHDAKLKACLRAVLAGRRDRAEVPEIARVMKDHIKFLKTNTELLKAL